MNTVTFVVLLFAVFFMLLFGKNMKQYAMDILKICHDKSDGKCCCQTPEKAQKKGCGSQVSSEFIYPTKQDDYTILETVGCFFTESNDGKNTQNYFPTPLQDVDPKGLA